VTNRAILAGLLLWQGAGATAQLPASDDLSFRGFAQEVLVGVGTRRTARFDGYTEGSYHVDPLELVGKLQAEAALYRQDLKAVVVVGPSGPLWAYEVLAVLGTERGCLRVNMLSMPHARITRKKSGCLAEEFVRTALSRFRTVATERLEHPKTRDGCVVHAEFSTPEARLHSPFDCYHATDAQSDTIAAALDFVSSRPELTYSHYPDVGPIE
jgi:hypothetical protein